MKKRYLGFQTMVHIVFAILTVSFILPFLIIISVSISNETQITDYGFKIIPKIIDLTAYKMIFGEVSKRMNKEFAKSAFGLGQPSPKKEGEAFSIMDLAMKP